MKPSLIVSLSIHLPYSLWQTLEVFFFHITGLSIFRACPHGQALQCCIVSAERSVWKCTWIRHPHENAALAFSCGRRIHILSISMTPPPRSLTSSLRPLNPATSRNNNNNNNGGLLLVFVFLATCLPCSQVWVAAVQTHYQCTQTILVSLHKPFSSSSCCVWFLCLLSVCLQRASLMHMLCLFNSVFFLFQVPPMSLEYELQRFESFSEDPSGCKYSWNDAVKDGGKKDCFGMCGQGLRLIEHFLRGLWFWCIELKSKWNGLQDVTLDGLRWNLAQTWSPENARGGFHCFMSRFSSHRSVRQEESFISSFSCVSGTRSLSIRLTVNITL